MTPTPTSSAPPPSETKVAIRNGTPRNGLAHTVAAALHARGYLVTSVGNAKAAIGGPSRVAYGPGAALAAVALAAQVPGAAVTTDPAVPAGTVELDIGSSFTALGPVPQPSTPSPSPTGCTSPRV